MLRPYKWIWIFGQRIWRVVADDPDDEMDVIGHTLEHVQNDVWEMVRHRLPNLHHNLPPIAQMHHPIAHLAKRAFPLMRANGDEIRPRVAVIIPAQANLFATSDCHVSLLKLAKINPPPVGQRHAFALRRHPTIGR